MVSIDEKLPDVGEAWPRCLVLSDLPGFQSEHNNSLFVGEWCTGANTHQGIELLPYPLSDKKDWGEAVKAADEAYEWLMDELTQWLDCYHGEKMGRKYWGQATGWFVRFIVEAVVERYTVLCRVRSKWPDISVIGLDEGQFGRPSGPRQFVENLRTSDAANLQLNTQISALLGLSVVRRTSAATTPFAANDKGYDPLPFRKRIPGFSLRTRPGMPRAQVFFYKSVMRRRTLLVLSLITGFKAVDLADFEQRDQSGPLDNDARDRLATLPVETELELVLLKILAFYLPRFVVEGWAELAGQARTWISRKKPEAIITGLGGLWDQQFAVWSAECQFRGTSIIGLQHGGTYGERAYSTSERHERQISDRYITWGWHENEKTIPLPAARLAAIPRFRKSGKGPILWVGTSDSRYVYQLGPRPVGPQYREYFRDQVRFASALSSRSSKDVLFRPYPTDFGWKNQPGLGLEVPVAIDDFSETFWERLKHSRLVVIDHPGSTTFLEALTVGRPAICFGRSEVFDIRGAARPFFDRLSRVSVFHECPEAAADLVNTISDDIDGWWNEPDRQSAVSEFRGNFAKSRHFFLHWRRFLLGLGKFGPV